MSSFYLFSPDIQLTGLMLAGMIPSNFNEGFSIVSYVHPEIG